MNISCCPHGFLSVLLESYTLKRIYLVTLCVQPTVFSDGCFTAEAKSLQIDCIKKSKVKKKKILKIINPLLIIAVSLKISLVYMILCLVHKSISSKVEILEKNSFFFFCCLA